MNEILFNYEIERTPKEHGHSRMFTVPVKCGIAPDGKSAKIIQYFSREVLTPVEIGYIEEEAIYIWKEQHDNSNTHRTTNLERASTTGRPSARSPEKDTTVYRS